MKKCYINGMACISAQQTFEGTFPDGLTINTTQNIMPAVKPDYSAFIAPTAGRRMAAGIKNGIAASAKALKEAGSKGVDAIITGTGMGCNIDSQKFLQAVINNSEEYLTPTSFIQSTHNTVGAQIALELQSKVYNVVYVNGAVSFESALIDAKLHLEEGESVSILVGGIEELAEDRTKLLQLSGDIKSEINLPFSITDSKSKGVVLSEGATFMVLSDHKQENTYAELKDIAIYNVLEPGEVEFELKQFLQNNGLTVQDIDAAVLGYNGDAEYADFYRHLGNGSLASAQQLCYKHLSGEYNTASSFGLWAAANIIKMQQVPDIFKINDVSGSYLNNILLYNQYKGRDHSFTLISKV